MILHVDMDAFFAAVEQRDTPSLKGKAVVVGGSSPRSVVATASYEARKKGIHSAMPMFQALRLCPHLIVVPPDKKKYQRISRRIMTLLSEYTPLIEAVSIDEAYLDVSGCRRIWGSPLTIAHAVQARINTELHLTCSIGIAPLKFMAKIASDINKPAGITLIEKENLVEFISKLDIEKVPGVGKIAMQKMKILGIATLGDVTKFNKPLLIQKFGKFGRRLDELARGIDDSPVVVEERQKSISSETTLPRDIDNIDEIKKELLRHAEVVGRDLRQNDLFTASVSIKFKFSDFSQVTRQKKINPPLCTSSKIYEICVNLALGINRHLPLRLIGVGVSGLTAKRSSMQMDLFGRSTDAPNKWESVDKAVDSITKKFGKGIVTKATLNE